MWLSILKVNKTTMSILCAMSMPILCNNLLMIYWYVVRHMSPYYRFKFLAKKLWKILQNFPLSRELNTFMYRQLIITRQEYAVQNRGHKKRKSQWAHQGTKKRQSSASRYILHLHNSLERLIIMMMLKISIRNINVSVEFI